ncbi:MAG: transporter [Syntrophomonas sp.]
MIGISNRLAYIFFLQVSILLLSLTGILAKKASAVEFFSAEFVIYYVLEILIFCVYAIMWQQIIKKFEISIAYANKGTLIIWTFIWARIFFKEIITINNILGALLAISGIVLVFRDAK